MLEQQDSDITRVVSVKDKEKDKESLASIRSAGVGRITVSKEGSWPCLTSLQRCGN